MYADLAAQEIVDQISFKYEFFGESIGFRNSSQDGAGGDSIL